MSVQATFEDALLEEALAKRHSTTSEAMEAGRLAQAYRTILTHFSQRYPKVPARFGDPGNPEIGERSKTTTCIAFDLMSVNLAGERRLLDAMSCLSPSSEAQDLLLQAMIIMESLQVVYQLHRSSCSVTLSMPFLRLNKS